MSHGSEKRLAWILVYSIIFRMEKKQQPQIRNWIARNRLVDTSYVSQLAFPLCDNKSPMHCCSRMTLYQAHFSVSIIRRFFRKQWFSLRLCWTNIHQLSNHMLVRMMRMRCFEKCRLWTPSCRTICTHTQWHCTMEFISPAHLHSHFTVDTVSSRLYSSAHVFSWKTTSKAKMNANTQWAS